LSCGGFDGERCGLAPDQARSSAGRVDDRNLLHWKSCYPSIKSTVQWTHASDTQLPELQRHPGAGRFVWSSAVEDDVAVAWDLRVPFLQFFWGEPQCAGNLNCIFVK
jgi:hypothetical protein